MHRIERGEASVTIGAYLTAMAALGLDVAVVDAATTRKEQEASRSDSLPLPMPMPMPMPMPTPRTRRDPLPERIQLDDFPQLRQLAWHIPHALSVSPVEAFGLYESHWRHVDADAMDAREREWLDLLIQTVGKGHLLV